MINLDFKGKRKVFFDPNERPKRKSTLKWVFDMLDAEEVESIQK